MQTTNLQSATRLFAGRPDLALLSQEPTTPGTFRRFVDTLANTPTVDRTQKTNDGTLPQTTWLHRAIRSTVYRQLTMPTTSRKQERKAANGKVKTTNSALTTATDGTVKGARLHQLVEDAVSLAVYRVYRWLETAEPGKELHLPCLVVLRRLAKSAALDAFRRDLSDTEKVGGFLDEVVTLESGEQVTVGELQAQDCAEFTTEIRENDALSSFFSALTPEEWLVAESLLFSEDGERASMKKLGMGRYRFARVLAGVRVKALTDYLFADLDGTPLPEPVEREETIASLVFGR